MDALQDCTFWLQGWVVSWIQRGQPKAKRLLGFVQMLRPKKGVEGWLLGNHRGERRAAPEVRGLSPRYLGHMACVATALLLIWSLGNAGEGGQEMTE